MLIRNLVLIAMFIAVPVGCGEISNVDSANSKPTVASEGSGLPSSGQVLVGNQSTDALDRVAVNIKSLTETVDDIADALPTASLDQAAMDDDSGPVKSPIRDWKPNKDRFGHLSSGRDGGPGGWRRPHPGVFIWGAIEEQPGRYDWKRPDRLIQAMQKDKVGILITLWPFADWDQRECHDKNKALNPMFAEMGKSVYPPCDYSAYSNWVRAVVERYDGDGSNDMPGLSYPIRHWEIGNEPEMQRPPMVFFQGNSDDYLKILEVSSAAVRRSDPSANVLLGGQAGMQKEMAEFWEPILVQASNQNLFDIGNIHSITSSDTFFSQKYREFLNSHGYEAKPFWITEVEINSSPRRQRSVLELELLPFTGSVTSFLNGAEKIIIAGAAYGGPRIPEEVRNSWEVVVRAIGNFETVVRISETSALFSNSDGTKVYALWGGATLPKEVFGNVKVTAYDGAEQVMDAKLVTSDTPVFVYIE